ncbi:MAG: hypothetical protein M3446_07815 [Actinomycetota bacterium]|nr:hypothetical protein [Actinomycetota bacterium]
MTLWPLIGGFDAYLARSFASFIIDVVCGFAVVALVLATWRTVGPVLPIIVLAFILYAYFGYLIPDGWLIGHRGYGLTRLTSQFAMGTEGIFGVPLDGGRNLHRPVHHLRRRAGAVRCELGMYR